MKKGIILCLLVGVCFGIYQRSNQELLSCIKTQSFSEVGGQGIEIWEKTGEFVSKCLTGLKTTYATEEFIQGDKGSSLRKMDNTLAHASRGDLVGIWSYSMNKWALGVLEDPRSGLVYMCLSECHLVSVLNDTVPYRVMKANPLVGTSLKSSSASGFGYFGLGVFEGLLQTKVLESGSRVYYDVRKVIAGTGQLFGVGVVSPNGFWEGFTTFQDILGSLSTLPGDVYGLVIKINTLVEDIKDLIKNPSLFLTLLLRNIPNAVQGLMYIAARDFINSNSYMLGFDFAQVLLTVLDDVDSSYDTCLPAIQKIPSDFEYYMYYEEYGKLTRMMIQDLNSITGNCSTYLDAVGWIGEFIMTTFVSWPSYTFINKDNPFGFLSWIEDAIIGISFKPQLPQCFSTLLMMGSQFKVGLFSEGVVSLIDAIPLCLKGGENVYDALGYWTRIGDNLGTNFANIIQNGLYIAIPPYGNALVKNLITYILRTFVDVSDAFMGTQCVADEKKMINHIAEAVFNPDNRGPYVKEALYSFLIASTSCYGNYLQSISYFIVRIVQIINQLKQQLHG
eukprot:TRINITY_DN4334_c0_g1_i1.p1 TRINITY_DN4334_c0_g1~~TRINITY_DN4334_c0_g1_i1.p1  ORF type:complete len:561 (-),score=65.07 TRINITY_DN4334_c0_g1_i1:21-1703(-)